MEEYKFRESLSEKQKKIFDSLKVELGKFYETAKSEVAKEVFKRVDSFLKCTAIGMEDCSLLLKSSVYLRLKKEFCGDLK